MPPSLPPDERRSGRQSQPAAFTTGSPATSTSLSASQNSQATRPQMAHQEVVDLTKDASSVNMLKHANQGVQAQLETPRKRVKTSSDTSDTLADENAELNKSKNAKLTKEIERLQKACTEKHHALAAKDQESARSQIQIQTYEKDIIRLQESNRDKDKAIQNMNEDLSNISHQLNSANERNTALQTALSSRDLELRNTAGELKNTKVTLMNTREDLGNAEKELLEKNSVLKATAEELKHTKTRLSKELAANESLHIVNDRQGVRLDACKKQQKEELTNIRKALKSTEKDLSGERTQHANLQQQHAKLLQHNKMLEKDMESQQEEWVKAKTRLLQKIQDSRGLSQRHDFKVSDSALIEAWETVKHKVGQFIDKYTKPLGDANMPIWTSLESLTLSTVEFLTHPHLYSLVWESSIWLWLGWVVFAPESPAWAGEPGVMLNRMLNSAKDHIPRNNHELLSEYHAVRSSSSGFLSRVAEARSKQLLDTQHAVFMVTIIESNCGDAEFDREGAVSDLTIILSDAVVLDTMLRKLKADIQICHVVAAAQGNKAQHSFPFQDAKMVRRPPILARGQVGTNAIQAPVVDLIVSPALIKRGNNDGSGYSQETYLAKMEVVCDVFHHLKSQRSQPEGKIPSQVLGDANQGTGRQDERRTMPLGGPPKMREENPDKSLSDTMMSQKSQDMPHLSVEGNNDVIATQSTCATRMKIRSSGATTHGCQSSSDPLLGSEADELDELIYTPSDSSSSQKRKRKTKKDEDEEYIP